MYARLESSQQIVFWQTPQAINSTILYDSKNKKTGMFLYRLQ